MGIGRSFKKAWSKTMGRGPLSIVGMGKGGAISMQPSKDSLWNKTWHEIGHGVGYLTGANAMDDLAEAQKRAAEQAERNAYIAAGNVQQTSEAGTSNALAKLLKKRSQAALAKASPTLSQARGNTTLG